MKIQSNLLKAAFAFGFATVITATASAQELPTPPTATDVIYYSGSVSLGRGSSANYTYNGTANTVGSLHALNVTIVSREYGNDRTATSTNSVSWSSGALNARIVNKTILDEVEAPKGAALVVFIPSSDGVPVIAYSTKNGSTTSVTPLEDIATITIGEAGADGPLVASSGNYRFVKGVLNGSQTRTDILPLSIGVESLGLVATGAATINTAVSENKNGVTTAISGSASVSGFSNNN